MKNKKLQKVIAFILIGGGIFTIFLPKLVDWIGSWNFLGVVIAFIGIALLPQGGQ